MNVDVTTYPRRYTVTLISILALAGGIAAFEAQAVFYMMPFIASDLALTNTQIGLIGSAVLVGWSLAAVAAALASDHLGRRKPFLLLSFGAFALLSGLSAGAGSFIMLFLARLSMGIAEGPIIPMQNSLVMEQTDPARRGLYMGIVQNFGAQLIGAMLAPILLVWLAQVVGWRVSFLLCALPALLVGALIWLFVREPAAPAVARPAVPPASRVGAVFAERNVKLCILIGTCCVGWYFLLLTFMPLWLQNGLQLAPRTMSFIMATMGAAGALAAILVPGLSDRIGRRGAILIFCSVGLLAPLGALVAGAEPLTIGVLAFAGFLMNGTFPLFMGAVPQESVAPENRATATALVVCVSQLLGGIAGPSAGGVLADMFGLEAPLVMAAVLALMAAALALLLREKGAPIRSN